MRREWCNLQFCRTLITVGLEQCRKLWACFICLETWFNAVSCSKRNFRTLVSIVCARAECTGLLTHLPMSAEVDSVTCTHKTIIVKSGYRAVSSLAINAITWQMKRGTGCVHAPCTTTRAQIYQTVRGAVYRPHNLLGKREFDKKTTTTVYGALVFSDF